MLVRMEVRSVLAALCAACERVDVAEGGFIRQRATQLSYALDACHVRLVPLSL